MVDLSGDNMKKIKIPNEFKNRIKDMQKECSVIFMTAYVGMGKTSVIQEYLRQKKSAYTYVSSEQNDFPEYIQNAKSNIIVVDDFQNISPQNEEYLNHNFYNLLRHHKFYILSRASMPAWLKPYQIIGQVRNLDGSVLSLTNQEVKEYLEGNQIYVSETALYQICQTIEGYPLALAFFICALQSGKVDKTTLSDRILKDIFDYYDEMVLQFWNIELYKFMLQVCVFERFTLGLASMVSGYPSVEHIIDEANRVGTFLICTKDEYEIQPFFRKYLLYKQKRDFSQTAIYNIYNNAGLYYELQSDIKNALKYYSVSKNQDKIRELLIRNSNLHPGIAHYIELEEYYRGFPKEKILETPDLMAGMCMLCSLNIQVEESEYWYKALQEYCAKLKKTDVEYKYAKGKLYWLDISLTHRGSANIEKLILNAVSKKNTDFVLQDISVTSNLPSVLNGGKDFSRWVMRADVVYSLMKPVVPLVFGKAGEGLADVCIAEKMLEQADPNIYQLMNYINSGIYEAASKGKMETQFVGVMLQHRLYLSQGNRGAAYQLMEDFKNQVEQKKQTQLLPNLNAVIAHYYLKMGDKEQVDIWMQEEAPNENKGFNVLERYRYVVKVRGYIVQQKYMEAVSLLNRILQYGTNYDRTIVCIQAKVLQAIVLYRTKDETWKGLLEEALLEAEKYQYIRMLAEEGTALLPLLLESQAAIGQAYKKKLLQFTKEEAMLYPSYLKTVTEEAQSLTTAEKQVLKLLGQGMKNKEISEFLNISLNTVAYHTKNIYQKLGVNSRIQATNIAKNMEL